MATFHSSNDDKWYIYAAKNLLPFMCCMSLLLLGISLPSITALEGFSILFPLLGVYYWALNGSSYFHPLLALFIGFWLDLMIGEVIGLYALIFLLCYIYSVVMRRAFWENSLLVMLSGFLLFGAFALLVHIFITKILGNYANFGELLISLGFSVLLYLPIYVLFDWLRRKLW